MTMFDFNTEVENIKTRCEDIRRDHELRSQIETAASEQPPFYAGALVSVGKMLVEVGSRLQAQYAYSEEQGRARSALDTGTAAS